jgi:DNA-binding CsgD family transcriptional regulator
MERGLGSQIRVLTFTGPRSQGAAIGNLNILAHASISHASTSSSDGVGQPTALSLRSATPHRRLTSKNARVQTPAKSRPTHRFADLDGELLHTIRSMIAGTGPHVLGLGEALDHLDHVIRQARLTRSTGVNCYVITGYPGTGKSRALEAARTAAVDIRIPAPSTAALLSDPEIPLRTLFRVLHNQCFTHLAGDRLTRIRWGDDAAGGRLDLLERIRDLLADIATMTPLAIMIDDFHLTDRSTASAVHHLVSGLRGTPILWLLAGRPRAIDDGGPDNFAMLHDLPVTELNLRPLDPPEIERLYGDRIDRLPAEVSRRIRAECDGNAYLIETLIGLGRSGLGRSGNPASARPAREFRIPDHVTAAVAARWLAGLSAETRTLLKNASAFPRRIDLSRLAELAGQPSTGATRSVEEAVAAGVLTGTRRHLRFRSRLVRESIHRSLSEYRRRSLDEALRPPGSPPAYLGPDHGRVGTAGVTTARSATAGLTTPMLTEAELKVVELVVTGMTNKAVARTLRLSPHTVDTHLRHAFVKLGVRSRTEMARTILLQDRDS